MPAPKGNKFGENNHNAGVKPFFDNPQELEAKIELYFTQDANKRQVVVGKGENKQVIEIPIYTITGLCYYLGFESRQSFYEYEKKEAFTYIIKKARLRIEQHYEEMLQMDTPQAGSIFALKNMDWKDKTETEHTGDITIQSEFSKLLDKQSESLKEFNERNR